MQTKFNKVMPYITVLQKNDVISLPCNQYSNQFCCTADHDLCPDRSSQVTCYSPTQIMRQGLLRENVKLGKMAVTFSFTSAVPQPFKKW